MRTKKGENWKKIRKKIRNPKTRKKKKKKHHGKNKIKYIFFEIEPKTVDNILNLFQTYENFNIDAALPVFLKQGIAKYFLRNGKWGFDMKMIKF